jgi:cation transport ATPase
VSNRATFGTQRWVVLPGRTVTFVFVEKKIAGLLAVADPIKQATAEAMCLSSVSVITNALRLRRVGLTA